MPLSPAPFAIALYRRLLHSPGNILFSPYSIAMALGMAHAGARGRTREEIGAALGVTTGELVEVLGALARELRRLGEAMPGARFQLVTANSLWHQQGYVLEADLVETLSRELAAEVFAADFGLRPGEAAGQLNAWIARATDGRIPSIAGQLPPLTRVILANAVYFKARWEFQFDTEQTRPEPFHLLDGRSVEVPMMHNHDTYAYARRGLLQVVRIAYGNDWFALTVLLPDEGRFQDAEREVSAELIAGLSGMRYGRDINLSLPRFRVESDVQLRPHCEGLGIVDAFGPGADFSGFSKEPGFAVSDLLHRAFVDVDENGTEAAAATATIMVGAALAPPKPLDLRVDRPFLFVISDRPTGTILFMGRVVDPRSA